MSADRPNLTEILVNQHGRKNSEEDHIKQAKAASKVFASNPSFQKTRMALDRAGAIPMAVVLSLSSDRIKNASPVVRKLILQMIDIRIFLTPLADQKLLLRFIEKKIRGGKEGGTASAILDKAEELFSEWKKGPKYRSGIERAFRLSLLWHEFDKSVTIHRDDIWEAFCNEFPHLVPTEKESAREAKSNAFKAAKLGFLRAGKRGR
jgi:hypothetical protein